MEEIKVAQKSGYTQYFNYPQYVQPEEMLKKLQSFIYDADGDVLCKDVRENTLAYLDENIFSIMFALKNTLDERKAIRWLFENCGDLHLGVELLKFLEGKQHIAEAQKLLTVYYWDKANES